MKKNIQISLFVKFSAIISVSLTVILSILAFIVINIQEKTLVSQKERNSEALTEFVSKISAFHIQKYSYFLLDENTTHLQSKINDEYEILSFTVYDAEGKRLNLNAKDIESIEVPPKYRLIKKKDCIIDGVNVGSIVIIFSLESIYKTISRVRMTVLIVIIASIMILNIALILILILLVTRPLKYLTYSAEIITGGVFDIELKYHSNDELGFLGKTFVNMCNRLKSSFDEINKQKNEIEKYSLRLEELVKERTDELNIANTDLLCAYDKMKKEFIMARKIQKAIMPKEFPISEKINIGGIYIPMDELGGDYYDAFYVSPGKLAIVVADVCGHGVPAALITTMAKVSFKSNAKIGKKCGDVVRSVNDELYPIIGKQEYLTAFFCIIDLENLSMEYTSAGHNDVYIFKSNGEIIELKTNSFIIGFSEIDSFTTSEVKIENGDRIVFYTDGIPETKNVEEELYGPDRFKTALIKNSMLSPKILADKIVEEAANFRGKISPDDDMTILIVDIRNNNKNENAAARMSVFSGK